MPQRIASSHRIREGLLRSPSGTPNIRQPVTSSSSSSTIHFPPALIPRILNDSISFRKSRDGILLSLQLPTTSISPCLRKFFRERPPPEPSHLPCDCHDRRPLAQEFREAVPRLCVGLAAGSRGSNETVYIMVGFVCNPRQRGSATDSSTHSIQTYLISTIMTYAIEIHRTEDGIRQSQIASSHRVTRSIAQVPNCLCWRQHHLAGRWW